MLNLKEHVIEDAEMTFEQLEFLEHLLEENAPKKIVEIGVAAGGTSVVILEKIREMNIETSMYSLDLSNEYYRDKSQKTGYLIDDYLAQYPNPKVKHQKMTGDYAVNFIDSIGNEIDFLILDTVHSLPGEILDFLAIFPFLKSDAIVVLHDIMLNHLSSNKEGFATQILLDCVVADKLTPINIGKEYPGIGAFRVNIHTEKYIEDVFNALMVTWKYIPDTKEINLYKNHYRKYYSDRQIYILDEAVRLNTDSYMARREKEIGNFQILYDFISHIKRENVYIYGHGVLGKKIYQLLHVCGIQVDGYIVSNKECEMQEVLSLQEFIRLPNRFEYEIVIGVNVMVQNDIVQELKKCGINKVIIPSEEVLQILP